MNAKLKLQKNIGYLRRLKGVTQEEMADAIGVKRSTLASWEEYRCCPDLDMLLVISDYLMASVYDLITRDLYAESKEEEKRCCCVNWHASVVPNAGKESRCSNCNRLR